MKINNRFKIVTGVAIAICIVGTVSYLKKHSKVYQDGTYRVEVSDFDKQGWKPYLEMTFEDNQVTNVVFDYVNDKGESKVENEAYNKLMMSKVDTCPSIYSKEFAVEIMVEQDMSDFDGVSGATHSAKEVKVMGDLIFEKARTGNTSVDVIPPIS